jgi:phosphoribosylglycinamide formyltransferase-1
MMRLAFLASNNGSSMRAVVSAIEAGTLACEAALVVSNRREAPALAFAAEHGIATEVIPTRADPGAADARLAEALAAARADLVILSGYLRRLGPVTLAAYEGRILNIHPALLPAHGGVGMYGRRVHEAVIAAGDAVSGASVHLVDEHYDHGEVLARVEIPVEPGETAQSLEGRVTAIEPQLFVKVLQALAAGTSRLGGGDG